MPSAAEQSAYLRAREPWSVTHLPAAATQATASKAAGAAGFKHHCTSISISLGSTTGAQSAIAFNLRDGASGAGTILRSWYLAVTAGIAQSVDLSGLDIPGSAATAMTIEITAAPAAATLATVSMTGYTAEW